MNPNKNYPTEVIEKLLDNQELQGNKRDISVFENDIELHKAEGGVNWTETPEGEIFWHEVLLNRKFRVFASKYDISVKGWLESLPNESRIKAFRNSKLSNPELITASSLKSALHEAFNWSNSPEKFDYWNGVATVNNK